MFNKKLKRRLVSLEDYLGIAYSPRDEKDESDEHNTSEWSLLADLEKMKDEWRKKSKREK